MVWGFGGKTNKNKQLKMIVGSKVIWGCDIAEVCSIVVNDFVMIKLEHNNKIENVHIDNVV